MRWIINLIIDFKINIDSSTYMQPDAECFLIIYEYFNPKSKIRKIIYEHRLGFIFGVVVT